MKCQEAGCAGNMRITHTYPVESLKFQRAVCERCGAVYRLDTVAVLARAGAGARAMAARARKDLKR